MKDSLYNEERPCGFIYITTNMINGKRYIGQKRFDSGSRWKSYLGSGYHLSNAIKRYGKENFKRDIVDIAFSENELNQKESDWINNYNAVESEDYYNKIEGGDVTESNRRKNSIKCLCITNGVIFNSIADASKWSGYTSAKIRSSFSKIHTVENFKREDYVFRPLQKKYINEKYCCVCGRPFKTKGSAQKRCEYHLTKGRNTYFEDEDMDKYIGLRINTYKDDIVKMIIKGSTVKETSKKLKIRQKDVKALLDYLGYRLIDGNFTGGNK